MTAAALAPAGLCRYCGQPSYRTDDIGAVHPCCLAWRRVIAAGFQCPACQIARMTAARGGRLPGHPPTLPRTLPDGTPFVPDTSPPGVTAEHLEVTA